jgi:hypothetical protein
LAAGQKFIPDATPDPGVLQLAADDGRVLVSRDAKTTPHHFAAFVANRSIGEVIEELLMMWRWWSAEDIQNQIWWPPG